MRNTGIAILIATSIGSGARAQDACAAYATLGDVQAAVERVASLEALAPFEDQEFLDLRGLMLRTDLDQVLHGIASNTLIDRRDDITRLMSLASIIVRLTDEGRMAEALSTAQQPAALRITSAVGRALVFHTCDGTQSGPAVGGPNALGPLRGVMGPTSAVSAQTFIVSVITAISLLLLIIFQVRYMIEKSANRRERRKRHVVKLAASLHPPNNEEVETEQNTTVVDLSRGGLKIKLAGLARPATGSHFLVQIGGIKSLAVVRWSNMHFAGLQFQKPLTAAQMRRLLSQSATRVRPNFRPLALRRRRSTTQPDKEKSSPPAGTASKPSI